MAVCGEPGPPKCERLTHSITLANADRQAGGNVSGLHSRSACQVGNIPVTRKRIAVPAALVVLSVAACTTLALRPPDTGEQPSHLAQDGEDAPPAAEDLARAADRLAANNLNVSDDDLAALAAEYGVGGAVRIVAWSGGDPGVMGEIRAMRDGDGTEGSAMGWGQIAKDLGVFPGIGAIMGNGGGRGPDSARGHQGEGD